MCEGYSASEESSNPDFVLDEFMCEYVDGTMDPAVRAVFEEYLRANPELIEQIECLRRTRSILCHYGCRCNAPRGLQSRLRQKLGSEMMQAQLPRRSEMSTRLGRIAAFTSAFVLMLMIGLAAGEAMAPEEEGAAPVVYGVEERGNASYSKALRPPALSADDTRLYAQPYLSAFGGMQARHPWFQPRYAGAVDTQALFLQAGVRNFVESP